VIHLGIDPGAFRLGYAIVEESAGFVLHDSGSDGLERGAKEPFQVYRKRLIDYWADEFGRSLDVLIAEYGIDDIYVTFEALPGQGSGNFSGGAIQGELAKTAAAVCQAMCTDRGVQWTTVSAKTVKKDVAGSGDATKVGVRNAVIKLFPQLEPRKKALTDKGADESDGIAIASWAAGYRVPRVASKRKPRKKK
jgi:Holliday junction resolvasome RuvABC endonuclease subunit